MKIVEIAKPTSKPGVLVVGGTGALGAYLLPLLRDNGFEVLVATRRRAPEQAALLRGVTYVVADPSTEHGSRQIIEAISSKNTNLIGAVFLNGAFEMGSGVGEIGFSAQLHQLLAANLFATTRVLEQVLPKLVQNAGSRIVLVSAQAASKPFELGGAYAISKSTVEALGRQLSLEYERAGVHTRVLSPAVIGPAVGQNEPELLVEAILNELNECLIQNLTEDTIEKLAERA